MSGVEERGVEERGVEERGVEERGVEERGVEERGLESPRASRPAAYRRPGMVVVYFAYRAAAALLLAAPASVLAAGVVGGYPRGDAVLFDRGGLMLTEFLRIAEVAGPALAAQAGAGAVLAAALGLVPLAALIVALGREGRLSAAFLMQKIGGALGPLALLWGAAAAAQVAAAGVVLLVGAKLAGGLAPGDRAEDLASIGVIVAALLAVGAVGMIHDVARVSAAHEGRGFYDAAARGLAVSRVAPLGLAWAWAWRGALACAALACAAWVGASIGVSSGGRVALSFGVHHAGLLAASALRASWLAAAMRRLEGEGRGRA